MRGGEMCLIAAIGGLATGIEALKWKNLAQFSPKKTTMTSLREMNKMARKEIIHLVTRSRIQGHPGLRTHLSFGETRTTSFMLVRLRTCGQEFMMVSERDNEMILC